MKNNKEQSIASKGKKCSLEHASQIELSDENDTNKDVENITTNNDEIEREKNPEFSQEMTLIPPPQKSESIGSNFVPDSTFIERQDKEAEDKTLKTKRTESKLEYALDI